MSHSFIHSFTHSLRFLRFGSLTHLLTYLLSYFLSVSFHHFESLNDSDRISTFLHFGHFAILLLLQTMVSQ